jgi:hypothetical protein
MQDPSGAVLDAVWHGHTKNSWHTCPTGAVFLEYCRGRVARVRALEPQRAVLVRGKVGGTV